MASPRNKGTVFVIVAGLTIGFLAPVFHIASFSWQFWTFVFFCNGLVAISKAIGESIGRSNGEEKVAGMQKYLDNMKTYYEDQLTKLGHKEKIL